MSSFTVQCVSSIEKKEERNLKIPEVQMKMGVKSKHRITHVLLKLISLLTFKVFARLKFNVVVMYKFFL